eukprot:1723018-Rhodomonas_salina.1
MAYGATRCLVWCHTTPSSRSSTLLPYDACHAWYASGMRIEQGGTRHGVCWLSKVVRQRRLKDLNPAPFNAKCETRGHGQRRLKEYLQHKGGPQRHTDAQTHRHTDRRTDTHTDTHTVGGVRWDGDAEGERGDVQRRLKEY